MARKKGAVILFNLGGPDGPDAVEPFLFNLFYDPAIIALPNPLRWLVAKLISKRRAPLAQAIYAELGGRSPLLPLTEEQAGALEARLAADDPGTDWRAFVAMRYWHPFAADVAARVKEWGADEVVLLPLYPQFSTTTTASSVKDWMRAAHAAGLSAPTRAICCYPDDAGFVSALADLTVSALAKAKAGAAKVRVLFSAHGLPKKVVAAGDPYQAQVERTAAAVVAEMGRRGTAPDDWRVSYQSRVGPLEWIGPATDDEIRRAGVEGVGLVVVPVAFVSEHSETLVELDIEYRHVADAAGVPVYVRAPAAATHGDFIGGLAGLVRGRAIIGAGVFGRAGGACASCAGFARCPYGNRLD